MRKSFLTLSLFPRTVELVRAEQGNKLRKTKSKNWVSHLFSLTNKPLKLWKSIQGKLVMMIQLPESKNSLKLGEGKEGREHTENILYGYFFQDMPSKAELKLSATINNVTCFGG